MENQLKRMTPFQARRKKKEESIFAEYTKLYNDPQQSRIEAMKYLARKYGYESIQGVYKVVNRLKASKQ